MGIISISPIPGEALVTSILGIGTSIIERLFPDPTEAAKAKLELLRMQQAGEFKEIDSNLQLALAQIKTNEAEASSGSTYAAGWRPTIGYIGAAALAWNFVGYPVANWAAAAFHLGFTPPPMLDTSALFSLITGMLGIGVMRTWEKGKGVAS